MLAISPNLQVTPYMFNQYDLLLPGIYNPGMVLLLKGKVNNNDLVGWSGLMVAVIHQAKIDAIRGEQTAAQWLASDQCFDYCYALGFEHENILAWLEAEARRSNAS